MRLIIKPVTELLLLMIVSPTSIMPSGNPATNS